MAYSCGYFTSDDPSYTIEDAQRDKLDLVCRKLDIRPGTRHPNYFGDACVWWGLSLVAFGAWPGILTLLSPVAMTWLLARGTGKPLLEKDIAERRPGYTDHVRRTSGFVPLPPKEENAP